MESLETPLAPCAYTRYFSWHYDAVPPTMLVNGGQRVCTLLVYLNDVPEGGRTAFRDLRAGGAPGTTRRSRPRARARDEARATRVRGAMISTPARRTARRGFPAGGARTGTYRLAMLRGTLALGGVRGENRPRTLALTPDDTPHPAS